MVAPVAGSISFTDYQAKAAGYYIVEKGSDGYDYFFAHCQKGSVVVAPEQAVLAGQPLCNVRSTGDGVPFSVDCRPCFSLNARTAAAGTRAGYCFASPVNASGIGPSSASASAP